MSITGDAFIQAERVVDSSGLCASTCGGLTDEELLEAHHAAAHLAAKAQKLTALTSSEIARRSDRSLGAQGLTARLGVPRVTDFIQLSTGGTKQNTTTLLNTGTVLAATEMAREAAAVREADPDSVVPETAAAPPWFAALSDALAAETLSMAVVDGIRAGLGATSSPSGALVLNLTRGPHKVAFMGDEERAEQAAAQAAYEAAIVAALPALIADCALLSPEAAQKEARRVRARVDSAGLLARSIAQGRAQYLKIFPKSDGMLGVSALLAPEYAELFTLMFEQLRHPRRAGRDFLTPEAWDTHRAEAGDLRDIDEYTVDGFMSLLRAGITIDPSKMLEMQPPAVRVVCSLNDLDTLADGESPEEPGFGVITGSNEPLPMELIEQFVCAGGIQPVRFDDDGECMNVGITQRFFTHRQRIALEVRDGGCMDPYCDRPVSWTEAHHILHWERDHGPTDLINGILLCHACHRRYHNLGYEIVRKGGHYWLIPPTRIDPKQTPILMRSKSALGLQSPVHLPPEDSAQMDQENSVPTMHESSG